jgi:hypothetical protein
MNLRLPTVLAAVLSLCAAARAAPADDLKTGLAQCAALSDARARLACYDRLAAGPPAETPAAAVAAAPSAPVPAAPEKDQSGTSLFGLDVGHWFGGGGGAKPDTQTTPAQFGGDEVPAPPQASAAPEAKRLDSITAAVVDYYYNPNGNFTVVLDNGQIWQQLNGDTDRARFKGKDQVTVSRGFWDSYNLVIAGVTGLYKVHRVK